MMCVVDKDNLLKMKLFPPVHSYELHLIESCQK